MRWGWVVLLWMVLLLLPKVSLAVVYPVYPTGTLQSAVDQAGAGDTIEVHAGIYREAVTLRRSGTSDMPITIRAAEGETAWLDGSEPLDGWIACTSAAECWDNPNWSHIYYTDVSDTVSAISANLFEGEIRLAMAQSPNPDNPLYYDVPDDAWYAIPDAGYTDTQIVAPAVFYQNDPGFWDGGYVMIWSGNNNIYTRAIDSFDPATGTITFEHTTTAIANRDTFSLLNHPSLIDQPGEYFMDEVHHRIYLWPHDAANLGTVTCSLLRSGIFINSQSHIIIDGLKFRRYSAGWNNTHYGVAVRSHSYHTADSITVRNCEATQNGFGGYPAFYLGGVDHGLVENNQIHDLPTAGIYLAGSSGSRGHTRNNQVRNNRIENINGTCIRFYTVQDSRIEGNVLIDNNGQHANGITCYLDCRNITIYGNRVTNSNVAITLNTVTDMTIAHNILKDHAATGSSTLLVCWDGIAENLWIDHNTILNADHSGISVPSHGKNVVISNNITDGVLLPDSSSDADYLLRNNLYVGEAWNMDATERGDGAQVETNLAAVFIDVDAGDYRPRSDSVAATMSTTGSYVGALSVAGQMSDQGNALSDAEFRIAYPNPAKTYVRFKFEPEDGVDVTIGIYNFHGERVASIKARVTLMDSIITWDAQGVAPGGYCYRIEENGRVKKTGKIFLQ